MAKRCVVPEALKHGPFTVAEAVQFGISPRQLRGSAWRRLYYGWYYWAGCELTEPMRLIPIARGLPAGFAFAGPVAARLHGLDVPVRGRPEVIVPVPCLTAIRVEAVVHRIKLDPDEIVIRKGFPVTSGLRTCYDLAVRLPPVEAVVALDQALFGGLVDLPALEAYIDAHAGAKGVLRARNAVRHAEPKSESPMETRLRMHLVLDGLPRPLAQVNLHLSSGEFVGRADLFYPEPGVAIEYDGANHAERLVEDNRRQNRFQEAGLTLLRYTAADLRERPGAILREVRAALARRPVNRTTSFQPE